MGICRPNSFCITFLKVFYYLQMHLNSSATTASSRQLARRPILVHCKSPKFHLPYQFNSWETSNLIILAVTYFKFDTITYLCQIVPIARKMQHQFYIKQNPFGSLDCKKEKKTKKEYIINWFTAVALSSLPQGYRVFSTFNCSVLSLNFNWSLNTQFRPKGSR